MSMNPMEPFLLAPKLIPPLDRSFRPAALATRAFAKAVRESNLVAVEIGLEQGDGSVTHFKTEVFPASHKNAGANFFHVERLVKFLLWSRGGYRIHFVGPADIAEQLEKHFTTTFTGKFDANIMGERIYEKRFEIVRASALPPERTRTSALGRHTEGYRIGFDLGASDRKAAAVIDGKVVFSEERLWDPVKQMDPDWHFKEIMDSLKRAAEHLPRVDAIGGSSAGVYVNNRVMVASLFRGVPTDVFNARVKDLFLQIKKAWKDIPFEIVNDGEVTALAGSMSLNENAVLGVAMGSSEAAGFVTPEGRITTWLNELAFVPVDYNRHGPIDEWSGDRGVGAQYFSQQCVGRLLYPAGIQAEGGLPEKLKHVQALMDKGDERARKIYETIGIYLGYGTAHYATFYDCKHVLVLGRVTTGPGGTIIVDNARRVLREEFPELNIQFHVPDEKEKRHGQAIAAASLAKV
jgi:predicted NBD/HSP70 family sugar kinase